MAKTPEEVKLWRAAQKLDSTNAMAEYKEAERTVREHLAKLRTERATREAASGPPTGGDKAKPARNTKKPKKGAFSGTTGTKDARPALIHHGVRPSPHS